MRIGKLLRRWRMWEEMEIRALAKELGVGVATIVRLENGATCDMVTFKKILDWLFDAESKRTTYERKRQIDAGE